MSYIWERLKEIKGNSLVFGRLCVVLVGDPVQFLPVLADSLLVESLPSKRREDVNGNIIYGQFSDVIILRKNNRLDETDSESVEFNKKIEIARDRKMNKEKRQVLIDKCSMF